MSEDDVLFAPPGSVLQGALVVMAAPAVYREIGSLEHDRGIQSRQDSTSTLWSHERQSNQQWSSPECLTA